MKNQPFDPIGAPADPSMRSIREAYQNLRRTAIAWQEVIRDRPDREELQRAHDVVFKRLTEEQAASFARAYEAAVKKIAPRKPLLRPSGKMMGKVKREAKSE